MVDYSNPNEPWFNTGYDPYKGMNGEERMMTGCLQGASLIVLIIMGLLLCAMLSGCTTTKYVPIESQHTEHHWHTDSVFQHDSVYTEIQTTIMELDSAEMAKYGIQLKAAERAWMVKSKELERQIQQLIKLTQEKDTVHDSIPIPYPIEVVKEVPAKLTWWQQTRLHLANILLFALLLGVIIWIGKRHLKILGG